MDGEFLKVFRCSNCSKFPENEIYQCQNGHTICESCVKDSQNCSTCRVSLGSSPTRVISLEKFLDMQKFDCPYKGQGCDIKVTRTGLTRHSEKCQFGYFGL